MLKSTAKRKNNEDNLKGLLDAYERDVIVHVLQTTHGNQSLTAELLGLSRQAMRRKIEKYAINVSLFRRKQAAAGKQPVNRAGRI
jgi:DNA-binding NtrC family response regulator